MEFVLSTLEKQEAMHDELAAVLFELKSKFSLRGCTSSDGLWEGVGLFYPDIVRMVKSLEKIYGPLDFNNLDSWLKQHSETISQHKKDVEQMQQNMQLLAEQGLDLSTLSIQDLETKAPEMVIEKMAGNNPHFKMMPSLFGPNWFSHRDAICDLSGLTGMQSEKQIPLEIFKPKIDTIANEILDLWKTLKRLEGEGRVRSFEVGWGQLHSEARNGWLQQFIELHRRPDLAICTLARHSKKPSDREPFLSPLLNIEDLAQANVLPDLLRTRSAIHPKSFLSADSRFVALGYWHKLFPKMHVQGRISFFSDTGVNTANSLYGIQFEPDAMNNLHLVNPITGYYSLMAQQKTYKFLVSCLSAQIEPPVEPTASTGRDSQSQPLSLLNLSAQLQYGRPDLIDWKNLLNMSKASAHEALDDLWQLRNDAEYWNMRFTDMQKSTSHLLRSVFGRIDVLLTVDGKLRSCRTDQQTSFCDDASVVRIPCDDTQVKGAVYMHSTFRSILNEMLSSMQNNEWLRRDRANGTLRYLFNLMAEDHPTIRLMGFGTMLRSIDRELSDGSAQEAPPLPIAQALHDMSVVAACMQETSKHYNLISNVDDNYARLANNATSGWRERERPWLFLIQGLLEKVLSKGNEFNRQARDENVCLEQRHRQFWNSIDYCMLSWSDSNPIVHMIFSQVPVPRASAAKSASTMVEARWDPQDTSPTPTATQKRKSRKRRNPSEIPEAPSMAAIWSTEAEPRSRPPVYITKRRDIEYWDRIRNQTGQERFETWRKFLSHIGFRVTSEMGGSIRTFELEGPKGETHKILFHEPHGRNGKKVPHGPARGLWADRLERHFTVIVSEKGTPV